MNTPPHRANAHWVMRVLDVQFEPASPLTGETFDLFIDLVCAKILDEPHSSQAVLGLPTWRERRDASRTLFACVLAGHIPGGFERAHQTALELRECASSLDSELPHAEQVITALHLCAEKIESYGLALAKTRKRPGDDGHEEKLGIARRVTRIERDLMSTLLTLISQLTPRVPQ